MTTTEDIVTEDSGERTPAKKRPGRAAGSKPLYRVVTNPLQVAPPGKLRAELYISPTDPREDGSWSAFWVREMTAGAWDVFNRSDKVYDDSNRIVSYRLGGGDFRMLKHCLWDSEEGGAPLFATYEEAEKFFADRGRSLVNMLMLVAQKVNFGTERTLTIEEVVADAEKNFEATSTSDSPTS